MTSAAVGVALLTAVYVTVLGSARMGDLAVAIALAVGLTAVYGRRLWGEPRDRPTMVRRILAFFPFAAAAGAEVLAGAFQTALVVLRLKRVTPGIVRVPIGERSPTGAAVTAATMTLSPGTALIDVDESQHVMLFHVIDASDRDEVRRRQQRFYDRFQRRVFP